MFFWNSVAFSMNQRMLIIWSLVPLPFLNPAWTSGSSLFTPYKSITWFSELFWFCCSLQIINQRAIFWGDKLCSSSVVCGAKSLQSCLTLRDLTVAHQAPLSMGFSRQEYWSGLPFPSPEELPDPGIKPESLMSPALAGGFFTTGATWEARIGV